MVSQHFYLCFAMQLQQPQHWLLLALFISFQLSIVVFIPPLLVMLSSVVQMKLIARTSD